LTKQSKYCRIKG